MLPSEARAVAFDAVGTLVEITDKRRPYARLLALASSDVRHRLRERVMRESVTLDDCLREAGAAIGEDETASLRADLEAELGSIRLRPRTAELWDRLRGQGVPIAVCSNLAAPQRPARAGPPAGPPGRRRPILRRRLPETRACDLRRRRGRPWPAPAAILFSGDTPEADVEGPRAAGLQAVLIGKLEAQL